jgi:hypothetical protein
MNSKQVLNKIMTLLSIEKEEVKFTTARLEDGTLVSSPTFDVGETLEVISDDGTRTPAPDGTHDLKLVDESGEEEFIRVRTEDGEIVERENIEMLEDVEVQDIPESYAPDESNVREDVPNEVQMEEEIGEEEDIAKTVEKMAIRIEELEKKLSTLEAMFPDEEEMEEDEEVFEDEEEDMELPKLDGAPVDEQRFSEVQTKQNYGKRVVTPQSSFLNKLYKN